jgi:hypothetical protein
VGAVVVRKKEVTNDFGVVHVTTTLRLAEESAQKVIVENQVTIDRPEEAPVVNPPFSAEFPAQFRLPAGMDQKQFWLPSLQAQSLGEELRTVCGREYNAQLFTWTERNETGPMLVKLWRSDDIPGRMLRQEITGHMHNSVEEVIDISLPQP